MGDDHQACFYSFGNNFGCAGFPKFLDRTFIARPHHDREFGTDPANMLQEFQC
jgi:hypothetical protein